MHRWRTDFFVQRSPNQGSPTSSLIILAIVPSSRLRCLTHETRLWYMHEPPTLIRISHRLSASFYAIAQPWALSSGLSIPSLAYLLHRRNFRFQCSAQGTKKFLLRHKRYVPSMTQVDLFYHFRNEPLVIETDGQA
jgi:hypothetical protein